MANDDTTIRRASLQDLEEVVALWSHYIRGHRENPAYRPAPDAIEKRKELFREHLLGDDSAIFVVAREDGGLDGMLTCFAEDNYPYFLPPTYARFQTPYVRPDARKRGNLKRLLAAGFRWARSMELMEVRLYTAANNVVANAIAEEHGFEAVEVVRRRRVEWNRLPEEQVEE